MNKQCCKCHKIKPTTDFYKNKSSHDKLSHACKSCTYTPKEKTNKPKIKYQKKQPRFSSLLEKYEYYVVKQDGCWRWTGPKNQQGYGILSLKHIVISSHRFSYEHYIGPIPEGKLIRHSCDNPECSNPEHLSTGDHKENAQDMLDRSRCNVGSRAYNAKLTEEDVINIRAEYKRGEVGYITLGKKYGVSDITIRDIILRKYWKHI